MLFRDNLESAMNKAGISAEDLAEKSGLSYLSIYNYLKGNHEPNYNSLKKICGALGISASKLMDGVIENADKTSSIMNK